jgi:hypothetical protein
MRSHVIIVHVTRSRQQGHVVQLDSDKCQGLVGTLGMKVMNQGDTWKPLSQCHMSTVTSTATSLQEYVTLGDLNPK